MTFQFSLWDKFRELSNLPAKTFNNLIQLVTRFLQNKCFSLSLLKVSKHVSDSREILVLLCEQMSNSSFF